MRIRRKSERHAPKTCDAHLASYKGEISERKGGSEAGRANEGINASQLNAANEGVFFLLLFFFPTATNKPTRTHVYSQ